MIKLKTAKEIEIMKEGGLRLREVVAELKKIIKPGITTKHIDDTAEELIIKAGGESSFKKVRGYQWTTCLPINEQVVHTPPSDRIIIEDDLLTIDTGMFYEGFHTDYALSLIVGRGNNELLTKFLEAGKTALNKAIVSAKLGNRIGDISKAIQNEITNRGYFILKELTGHGIGRELHEDPYVLGFLDRPIDQTPVIKAGLVIAIETIYSMGTENITHEKDNNWSIITADNSLSACFEHTIAVTDTNTIILT